MKLILLFCEIDDYMGRTMRLCVLALNHNSSLHLSHLVLEKEKQKADYV